MIIESLGFVEVRGAANAIAVADAMLKSSNVRILSESRLDPGQVTVIVEGDLGACHAAVEVGADVARRNNCLVGVLVKGKPDPAIEGLFYGGDGTVPPPVAPSNPPPGNPTGPTNDLIPPSDNSSASEGNSGARAPRPRPQRAAAVFEMPVSDRPASGGSVSVLTSAKADDVLAYIASTDGGTTVADVANAFRVGVKTARRWVAQLVNQGKVERFNRGIRARAPD